MPSTTWLYPANTKIYDVFKAFQHQTCWPMSTKVTVGDTVYIYLSAPYKQLGYRCTVTDIGVDADKAMKTAAPFMKQPPGKTDPNKQFMMLQPVKTFAIKEDSPLNLIHLKENGLAGMLMGPRKLDNAPKLLAYINQHQS